MYIATLIHNQSLGCIFMYDTFEKAFTKAHSIAAKTLDRELYENELFLLEEDGEVFIEHDYDNQYTFCVGLIED